MTTTATTPVTGTTTVTTGTASSAESSVTTSTTTESTTTETTVPPVSIEYPVGDVDGKNGVGVEDAQLALLAYVNIMAEIDSGLTPEQLRAADVNRDGQIGVDDAQLILLYYVNNTLSGNDISWEELIAHPAS